MKLICLFILTLLFTGCSKDIYQRYNNRIIGDWDLTKISKFGVGSSRIVFDGGRFSFREDGRFLYTDREQERYTGSWRIEYYTRQSGNDNTETIYALYVDAENANTGDTKFETFHITNLNKGDRFKAQVENEFNTVTYTFERR